MVTTGMGDGKHGRAMPKEKDGRESHDGFHGANATNMKKATKDKDVSRNMIANAYRLGTV